MARAVSPTILTIVKGTREMLPPVIIEVRSFQGRSPSGTAIGAGGVIALCTRGSRLERPGNSEQPALGFCCRGTQLVEADD
jgi:hypothetical protein